jgi:uncharacterized lipoprotein YddW (UPF0748 family)
MTVEQQKPAINFCPSIMPTPSFALPWNRKIRRRLAIALISCFSIVFLWPAALVPAIASESLSGTWMTHFSASALYHSTRLDNAIADLAKRNINTLYPAVWDHGHTLYSSSTITKAGGSKRNPWLHTPLSGDILMAMVNEAHRQHLRLIPWFEYGLMIPLDAQIVQQHPDWLTRQQNQALTDDPKDRNHPLAQLSKAIKGGQQGWLNPFHPEVQEFLVDLIGEVVKNYQVDGIQLDDHFGLPIAYGYDPYTVSLYRSTHQGQSPPHNPADDRWVRWRADRLTGLMARIHQVVKANRPEAVVSLSPHTPDFAYRKYLQNWSEWVDRKLLDDVVVQIYRSDLGSLRSELERPNLRSLAQRIPLSIGLYSGPFGRSKDFQQVEQEVATTRAAGYKGIAFFSWESTFGLFH